MSGGDETSRSEPYSRTEGGKPPTGALAKPPQEGAFPADTGSETPRPAVSLERTVRERTRLTDLGVLLLVPALLVAAFALPAEIRRSLRFEYADPSVLTAFTSAFVHLDPAHLFVNVSLYLLVVPVSFVLSVSSDSRRRFYTAFVTFLLVFPPVLSYLNLAVVRPAVTLGFSGVVMAFFGYLPLALAASLDVNFDVGPRTASAPALFFFSLALVSVSSVRSVVPSNRTVLLGTSGLALAATLSAVLYASPVLQRADRPWSKLRTAIESSGYFELLVLAVVLFLALPFVAFPADPAVDGGTLNLYVHLLGYALGFMTAYLTVETTVRLDSWRSQTGDVDPGRSHRGTDQGG